MDSSTILRRLGLDPREVLEHLDPEERRLLQRQADEMGLTVPDIIALGAAHDLSLADLRQAEIERARLVANTFGPDN